jgi:hypothetical protein
MTGELEMIKHLILFAHAYLSVGGKEILFIAANTAGNTILYPRKDIQVEASKEGNVYKMFHDFDHTVRSALQEAVLKQSKSSRYPKLSGALSLGLTCILRLMQIGTNSTSQIQRLGHDFCYSQVHWMILLSTFP